jgi:molecular chaperone DnaK
LIYSTEKSLGEVGDKLPETDKTNIRAAIEQLKKDVEGGDVETIKASIGTLTEASHKLAEFLYAQATRQQAAAGEETTSTESSTDSEKPDDDDNVVDAEFEEIKKD